MEKFVGGWKRPDSSVWKKGVWQCANETLVASFKHIPSQTDNIESIENEHGTQTEIVTSSNWKPKYTWICLKRPACLHCQSTTSLTVTNTGRGTNLTAIFSFKLPTASRVAAEYSDLKSTETPFHFLGGHRLWPPKSNPSGGSLKCLGFPTSVNKVASIWSPGATKTNQSDFVRVYHCHGTNKAKRKHLKSNGEPKKITSS